MPAALLEPGQTWVLLGDSITEDPEGYAAICSRVVERRLNGEVNIVNAGVSGNKASDMLARFERDVLSHRPNLVSISVGVNDMWHGFYDFDKDCWLPEYDPKRGVPLEKYRDDVSQMVRTLRSQEISCLLVSPTMIGEDKNNRENTKLAGYVAAMKNLSEELDAMYCPMNECMWRAIDRGRALEQDFRLTTDGVHMNKIGAHAMAACLLATLGFSFQEVASK